NEGWGERFLIAVVIVLTAVLVYLTLRSAPFLYRLMGESGLSALSRIMGFLVMAIGVQYIIVSLMDLGRQLLGAG
ncbi:MAG: MarC family protein, partial [Bacteroidetes bacterium]